MRRIAAVAAALVFGAAAPAMGSAAPRVVGYWDAYSAVRGGATPRDLPLDRLSVLDVDLSNPGADGTCGFDDDLELRTPLTADRTVDGLPGTGIIHQLELARAAHPRLRMLAVVAQLDPARDFAHAAATARSRRRFVTSCITRYIRGRYPGLGRTARVFDGIDLDWEVPHGATARHNFTLLVREFRRQLNRVRPGLLLTAAISAAPSTPAHFQLRQVWPSLDWIGLMAYDLHGSWSQRTTFSAPLRRSGNVPNDVTADTGVRLFLRAGVPGRRIMLGVPFFGQSYAAVAPGGDGTGINRPFTGVVTTSPFDSRGAIADADIPGQFPGAGVFHDPVAAQAWRYDPATRRVVAFDDGTTLAAKAAYTRRMGLGGMMIWEVTQDSADAPLLQAMRIGLGLPPSAAG
ncbi:MAG: glycoside hydrolase family 18 protein [Thermoleophilia bacterium]